MSLRGRVIRRQQVSCYLKPQSYQEQVEQYNYLSRALRMRHYEAQTWSSYQVWLMAMQDSGRVERVKDVMPSWTGREMERALKIPLNSVFSLVCWWSNIQDTQIQTGSRSGFVYKLSNSQWVDTTTAWTYSGYVKPNSPCVFTVVSSSLMPVATLNIGTDANAYQRGDWDQSGGSVVECWYVNPMFDTDVHANGEAINVAMVDLKSEV